MDSHWGTPNHRKRKRRRGPERPPISAQLFLDSSLKGDVGVLSEDLFGDLFPVSASGQDKAGSLASSIELRQCYVAITPSLTPALFTPESASWTILSVKAAAAAGSGKQQTKSGLHFPASSSALQPFVAAFQKASPNRPITSFPAGVDIQILDVAPIELDTVVVSIDEAALRKLEIANQEFNPMTRRRGSRSGSDQTYQQPKEQHTHDQNLATSNSAKGHWDETVRTALSGPKIIHAGDLLPLSLLSHPITHVAPPPAMVEHCEPVSQGILVSHTKVVVISSASKPKRSNTSVRPYGVVPNGVVEEEDDTSNEQFYSAAEEKGPRTAPRKFIVSSGTTQTETEDSETSNDEDTDLSDGEGDTIGLNLPMLPTQSSGALSVRSSATPRPGQLGGNGTATPGSVVSAFSTSTIRGATAAGRLFETHGLLSPIPDEVTFPRPSPDEDEEARIYTDTSSLVKIGCFSGDWVWIEAATDSLMSALGSLNFGGLGSEQAPQEWRVAKIYALPGTQQSRPRYAIDRTGNRRTSLALAHFEKPSLKAYLSPLFLVNLGSPSNVRIASLAPPQPRSSMRGPPPKNRTINSSLPPVAKEVTFTRLLTPLATERTLDAGMDLAVRKFFQTKQRIVKNGDLVGVPIDPDLSQAVFQGSSGEDKTEQEEILLESGLCNEGRNRSVNASVVWYKISSVVVEPKEDLDEDEEISWGTVAVVKPGSTRLAQAGSHGKGRPPETIHSHWQYYLGAKRLPVSGDPIIGSGPSMEPAKPYTSQIRRRLRELVSVATSPQAIHLGLPPVSILLLSTQRHIGKATVALGACSDLGLHLFSIDAYDIVNEGGGGGGDVKTATLLETRAERGLSCGPENTAMLIKHLDVLSADRMAATLKQITNSCRVFIATTSDIESVSEPVRSLFTHELDMTAPDEGEREGLLRDIVQELGLMVSPEVDFSAVAAKTAALVAGDLVDVVERAVVARRDRLEKLAASCNNAAKPDAMQVTTRDIQLAGGESTRCVVKADFDEAVEAARKNFADAIGAPKIPNVTWDDVGGLENVKDAVMETIQLPLERPELFAKGMKKRSGILFYGPPGTGKTLLAKAIATEFSLNFFSVKGPELLNMYIGESEANVRRVFQRARDARPCVVFFDELDSVAPKRGNQGDSGGVMDRIVSQLLAELDGMSSGEDSGGGVFVIGATNRPDLLDQALLRPGRFDKMLYLGVSDTHEKQLTILEALTRKFTLHSSLELSAVAGSLPFTYTGADLYALCSDAMLKAITRRATSVDAKVRSINATRAASNHLPPVSVGYFFDHLASDEDTKVVVEQVDFDNAVRELIPSVSTRELEHYERVKSVFEKGQEKKNVLVDRPRMRGSISRSDKGDHDDFLLRTEGLTLNERVNGVDEGFSTSQKSKAKGKGRQASGDQSMGFGTAVDDDEFLYSP